MTSIPARLDHLVLATPELSETVAGLEAAWGVTFLPGGVHPAWGTRNAILPLGPGVYLEVIGPEPGLSKGVPTIFGMQRLRAAALVTWAARAVELPRFAASALAAGIDLGKVAPGRRQRPDGRWLSWELTDPLAPREEGVLPFFIDWGSTPHPSASTPAVVRLTSLHAEHPEPGRIAALLERLGVELPVGPGRRGRLRAAVETPRGEFHLPLLPG